jgi:Uma2 family endonuclease
MGQAHSVVAGISLRLPPGGLQPDGGNFFEFCQINRDYRIERTAEGEVLIMSPTGGETGHRNSDLVVDLGIWARRDQTGIVFDSSTGFILPNGATRSPDVAWVKRERLVQLPPQQKKRFLPLAPDFLIELASPSDSIAALQDKMQEYLANGVHLAWLLLPEERQVFVYQAENAPLCLDTPSQLDGAPLLSGFVLDLQRIWDVDF